MSDARDRNINLTLTGGMGVYIHCHSHQAEIAELYRKVGSVGHSLLGDLDLIASINCSTAMTYSLVASLAREEWNWIFQP